MSAGENPAAMPWRAATNPAAQNSAAPAPQAMPAAVAGTSDRGAAGLDCKRFLSQRGPTRPGTIISSCRGARAHYQWEEGFAHDGRSRRTQHRHSARRPPGAGGHHVELGGDALRGAAVARVPHRRDARGRGGARRHQIRRRAHRLRGRLDRARAHSVRRRPAHAVCDLPQRAGAGGHARDRRGPADGGVDRAGRQISARHELDRGAAGRRGRRLDRRRGGVLSSPCPRIAPAPARRRHPRGRIRQQRSVRGSAHPAPGRLPHGRRAIVVVLNRLGLAQGLHAPFVATSALVIFGLASALHASGFLAVYLAGLVVGNRPTRAHNTVVVFLDAVTWLAQIVMFVLLGLLVWPGRLVETILPALAVAAALMFIARPAAVFLCLAPFRFAWREKAFISWVGLRGAVGIFLASIPLLVGLPHAHVYFDIAFVAVLTSLLIQGWTIAAAARRLHIALPRHDPLPRRVELDLPGQLEQELVGYPVAANSPYLKRGLLPASARPTLVVREQKILSPLESQPVRPGDYVYVLAPPEKAQALDRFL